MSIDHSTAVSKPKLWESLRGGRRMTPALLISVSASALIAGCWGFETETANVTATSATLNSSASCDGSSTSNPCTGWFQYWQDGAVVSGGASASVASSIIQTAPFTANVAVSGVAINQPISGLTPGVLYHSQFCGYGDTIQPPGLCASPMAGGALDALNPPGQLPTDPGDLSATENFRTATSGTVAALDLGRVLSTADVNSNVDHRISRDSGYSVQYSAQPAMSLWMFGDTVQRNGPSFIAGTTAAAGSFTAGAAPTALNELPTPPAAPTAGQTAPARFFPVPTGLKTSSNQNCGAANTNSYAASWPAGGAQEPGSSKLVLVYSQVCVVTNSNWPTGRFTLTEYDPASNKFTATYTPFVASPLGAGLPPTEQLGSPVFGGDGYLYLFGSSSAAKGVYVARVSATPSKWGSKANYKWWGGTPAQWGAESAAISVVTGVTPGSVSVGNYFATTSGVHAYVMLVQTSFGLAPFSVYEASTPTGPWGLTYSAQVADACTSPSFGCYAVIGHPELSTWSQLVYSWYSPDDQDGFGHVRIGAINWQPPAT